MRLWISSAFRRLVRLLLLQSIDQFHSREEAHPFGLLLDRLHANGRVQVRLASARPANEHRIVSGARELGTVQFA